MKKKRNIKGMVKFLTNIDKAKTKICKITEMWIIKTILKKQTYNMYGLLPICPYNDVNELILFRYKIMCFYWGYKVDSVKTVPEVV